MLKIVSAKAGKIHDFSTVQANLPNKIAKEIIQWGKDNIPEQHIFKEDGHGRSEEIHCTVKYGLHTKSFSQVENILKDQPSFEIELSEVSRFAKPDKDYDVAKIEVKSTDLEKLHDLLGELKNSDEYQEYKPHVTIAYLKKGTCQNISGNDTFQGRKIKINELVFGDQFGKHTKIQLV